jgi:Uma2 family endonuclease
LRYVRAPVPLHFPTEAEMPETTIHLVLRTFLFQLLRFAFGESCSVGSDQFVYWRASDPKTCLAPDAFVKLGLKNAHFDSWKTWERGAPELAVEIVSDSDRGEWEDKVERYRDLGVRELVRFDPAASAGKRIRIWDRVQEDLVERALDEESAESFVLERFWVVGDVEGGPGLRLADDSAGATLVASPLEAESRAREAETQAREAETQRARKAEQRVLELEAELERRG